MRTNLVLQLTTQNHLVYYCTLKQSYRHGFATLVGFLDLSLRVSYSPCSVQHRYQRHVARFQQNQ